MKKGIIIAAFATCGKTYLGKKYKNVIDLESSSYKYDNTEIINIPPEERKGTIRRKNPNWPNNYYNAIEYNIPQSKYSFGDDVYLKKGTLLHGTYKNIDGLKGILKDGLISSWFIDGRLSKYPSSVGVWNLKKDYPLKEYIFDCYITCIIFYLSMMLLLDFLFYYLECYP